MLSVSGMLGTSIAVGGASESSETDRVAGRWWIDGARCRAESTVERIRLAELKQYSDSDLTIHHTTASEDYYRTT